MKVAQLCPTLCDPTDSPWNSPGRNSGMGSLSLLQRIFPTQEYKPGSPALSYQGRPSNYWVGPYFPILSQHGGRGKWPHLYYVRGISRLEGLPGNSRSPPTPCSPHTSTPSLRGLRRTALEAPWWFPLLVSFGGTTGFREKCGHLAQDSAKAIGASIL